MSESITNLDEAVAALGALPMPVGTHVPPWPPAPRDFEEKLRQDVARLQGLLAEAVAAKHLADRERDLMRERVSEPFGCKCCGAEKRWHGRRSISGAGVHGWERPSDEQVKARMLARRAARLALDVAHDAGRRERYAKALYEFVNGAFVWEACDDGASWLEEADAAIVVADAEQAELKRRIAELEAERHTTNEALDDAVQELRTRRREPDDVTPQVRKLRALLTGQRAVSFFQPGHTYAARANWPDGRERFRFRCESVATDPESGEPRALGQHGRRTVDGGWAWSPNPRTFEDWRGGVWTDITEEADA